MTLFFSRFSTFLDKFPWHLGTSPISRCKHLLIRLAEPGLERVFCRVSGEFTLFTLGVAGLCIDEIFSVKLIFIIFMIREFDEGFGLIWPGADVFKDSGYETWAKLR